MRAIAVVFLDGTDAAAARADLEGLDPPPAAIAGGLLGAAGQRRDGDILLAIHVDDERVGQVRAIVERHRGEVLDVIRVRQG
jgi:hypothetical protein